MRHSAGDPQRMTSGLAPVACGTPVPALLLNAHEAALALRISERNLWAKTKAGEVPHVRIGGRVLYSPAHLQEWIDSLKTSELANATIDNSS